MIKENEGKWICALSEDVEVWRADAFFNTKEEAIEAGRKAVIQFNRDRDNSDIETVLGFYAELDEDDILKIAVGQIYTPYPSVDPDYILESAYENVASEMGEFAEGYLDNVKKEHKDELENFVNEWFIRHDYIPSGFMVQNVEEHLVKGEPNAEKQKP